LEGNKHVTQSRQIPLVQITHAGTAAAVDNALRGSIAPGGAAVPLLSGNVVVEFDMLLRYSHIYAFKLTLPSNLSDSLYRNYVAQ
jgi:hypothetical protein